MSDEWRVEVELEDERRGHSLGDLLRSRDLDDEVREKLGHRVIVTRDGARLFLYAGTAESASQAEGFVRDLAAEEGLGATIAVTRWHPDEGAWKDASLPLPRDDAEREAERARHEAAARREAEETGSFDWEVRLDAPGLGEARELGERLEGEGLHVQRRWTHIHVGAPTREDAEELAERLRASAPEGTAVAVEASPTGHPVFVMVESAKPGIARDLGL